MDGYSSGGGSENQYSSTNRVRAQLIRNGVYPEKVRGHAREVLEDVEPGVERYRYAAALTEFVYKEVDGVAGESNKELFRPDYILDHGVDSDCEDQAVLLASLLEVRSFNTRFIGAVNDGSGNHLMVQVRFPENSISELEQEAEDFYNGKVQELVYQPGEDGGAWLLCDPVFTPVPGCVNTDFFGENASGELVVKESTQYDIITLDE
jgi:transglutaminase-like putative cysteine protease